MNLRFVLLVLPQFISSHSLVVSWHFEFDPTALEVSNFLNEGRLFGLFGRVAAVAVCVPA